MFPAVSFAYYAYRILVACWESDDGCRMAELAASKYPTSRSNIKYR